MRTARPVALQVQSADHLVNKILRDEESFQSGLCAHERTLQASCLCNLCVIRSPSLRSDGQPGLPGYSQLLSSRNSLETPRKQLLC